MNEPEKFMVFHAALVQMFARRPRGRFESISILVVLRGKILIILHFFFKVYILGVYYGEFTNALIFVLIYKFFFFFINF